MIRMAGSMEKSTEVMKAMEKVIKLPEVRKNMMDLAREMHKASFRGFPEIIGSKSLWPWHGLSLWPWHSLT